MGVDARVVAPVTDAVGITEVASRRVRYLRLVFGVGALRFWRDALRRRLLLLADFAALVVAAGVASTFGGHGGAAWAILLFTPGWLLVAKVCGLYDRDHRSLRHLTTDEIPRLVIWVLAGTAAMTLVELPFDGIAVLPDKRRLTLLAVLVFSAVCFRSAARAFWRASVPRERIVIIGDGALAAAARRKLELFPDIHAHIVRESAATNWTPEELDGFLDGADRVVLAARSVDEPLLAKLVRLSRERRLKLSVVPPMRAAIGTAVELSHVADLPLVEYYTWDASRTTLAAKRAVDIFVAGCALVVFAPLVTLLALLVKVTSGGPAFFVQERAGLRGRPFKMAKLRTMVVDAPARRSQLDADLLDALAFKRRDDPRVTSLGRFLRRTSLDELPQLLNVLRGDMSLVGPRPEEIEVVERYLPEHMFRLTMKPGLTGPMQVYGRGALTFEERLAVDRAYIEGFSFAGDLRILCMTIASVLRRRGAY